MLPNMNDRITANGMVWGRVEPLIDPLDYEEFQRTIIDALGKPKEQFRPDVAQLRESLSRREAIEFQEPRFDDPHEVKWALLLPPKSPQTEEISECLAPLVRHRDGQVIFTPEWDQWIDDYKFTPQDERPYYVLIAGKPTELPFRFQYLLDVSAAVGRICFENPEDYATYASKVVDFETRPEKVLSRRAIVFAPELPVQVDQGATSLSRQFMTDPIVKELAQNGIPVTYLPGDDATLPRLLDALKEHPSDGDPALVFTAGHGLGVPGTGDLSETNRRRLQGSIICQDYDGVRGILSADQVPTEPFLQGSIVVTYACYGAGTPKCSEFFHWYRDSRLLRCRPMEDFIAALPQRLLAHPKGPLAFFGHVDPSFATCFADPKRTAGDRGWGSRMGPFREAVNNLMKGATIGYSVKSFNGVYAIASVDLANREDQVKRDPAAASDERWRRRLVDTWMIRNDMQNFVLLGDPAVRAKIAIN